MAAKGGSAGILLHRKGGTEVLLVHPGGPYWARKDDGAWSIPKGELDPGEDPRACALREFAEETGTMLPPGELAELEWPPRSGRRQAFPEVDRAGWFGLAEARAKLNPAQAAFVDRLEALLGA